MDQEVSERLSPPNASKVFVGQNSVASGLRLNPKNIKWKDDPQNIGDIWDTEELLASRLP